MTDTRIERTKDLTRRIMDAESRMRTVGYSRKHAIAEGLANWIVEHTSQGGTQIERAREVLFSIDGHDLEPSLEGVLRRVVDILSEPSAETNEMQKAEDRRKQAFVDPQNYAVHPEPSAEERTVYGFDLSRGGDQTAEVFGHIDKDGAMHITDARTTSAEEGGERGMNFTIEQVVHRIITKGRVSMSGASIAYEGVVVFPEKHGIFCRKSVEVRGLGEPKRIMNADLYIRAVDVIEASQKEEAKETMCRVMKENE